MSSLVYLLVWSPPPHILYISSPNQCLFGAAHAHTIATCFAVESILYHLFLIFLSTPYLELCLLPFTHPSDHSHRACWSATSFSFLTGQVSLPCSILLRTQMLYSRIEGITSPASWTQKIAVKWRQSVCLTKYMCCHLLCHRSEIIDTIMH